MGRSSAFLTRSAKVVAVRGESFVLLDESEKTRRLASWAGIEASMARQGSPIARFQWLERTLPEIGDEMRAHFNRRSTVDSPARESYAGLLDEAQPVTQQHETFVVVQVSGNRAARAIKHAGGGDRGAKRPIQQPGRNVRRDEGLHFELGDRSIQRQRWH